MFVSFNLRFLQLFVSIFAAVGTSKKWIRTIPDETLRVIYRIVLGKENETFGYLLYYESFKWASNVAPSISLLKISSFFSQGHFSHSYYTVKYTVTTLVTFEFSSLFLSLLSEGR